jgi:hypothetical protein
VLCVGGAEEEEEEEVNEKSFDISCGSFGAAAAK